MHLSLCLCRYILDIPRMKVPAEALAMFELEASSGEEIFLQLRARQCPFPHFKDLERPILKNALLTEGQKGHPGARILSRNHLVPKKKFSDIIENFAGIDTDSDEEEVVKGKKKKKKRMLATDLTAALPALGYTFPTQWFSHFDQVCAFAPLVTAFMRDTNY